eukprot:TRINITY_DN44934_c0_g1_i2.p1 TRINITY_DN44934_c0_g1~~TRINITY_DN44934_c0_g1_i2.p1  ORF type:complete len:208 (-),score=24.75 TRINITY_DN44934_c0_g1_i2:163-786(-)
MCIRDRSMLFVRRRGGWALVAVFALLIVALTFIASMQMKAESGIVIANTPKTSSAAPRESAPPRVESVDLPTVRFPNLLRKCLRSNRWRTDEQLSAMQGDDFRNTVIAELSRKFVHMEAADDDELISICSAGGQAVLASDKSQYEQMGECLTVNNWRSESQLRQMPHDERRNTMIIELSRLVTRIQGISDQGLAAVCAGTHESRANH